MKRILLSLLCITVLFCNANAQVLKGDMNGDGDLTVADITSLVNHILTNKREYDSSDVTDAKNEIQGTWYNTKLDYIKLQSSSINYDGTNYSKYAYYPALGVIHIYGANGGVKNTLLVKEKNNESMTLILPDGKTKTYYTTCPPAPVESITLSAGKTSLYIANAEAGLPAETVTITATVLPEFADNTEVWWYIDQDKSRITSITEVSSDAKSITVQASKAGGARIIGTAKDGTGIKGIIHIETKARPTLQAVDLGTGVKWASMNVGANAPEEDGRYYAWGEISAYGQAPSEYPASFTGTKNSGYTSLTTKTVYDWTTYKYCQGNERTFTKYNGDSANGIVDNVTTLELEDDAAHANMGGDWRMPTKEEADKLMDECYWQWVTSYNGREVTGYVVYKVKNDADKGKCTNEKSTPTLAATYSLTDTHIFLPSTGYYGSDGVVKNIYTTGYWLSTNRSCPSAYSDQFGFRSENLTFSANNKYKGYPIRAVCP